MVTEINKRLRKLLELMHKSVKASVTLKPTQSRQSFFFTFANLYHPGKTLSSFTWCSERPSDSLDLKSFGFCAHVFPFSICHLHFQDRLLTLMLAGSLRGLTSS